MDGNKKHHSLNLNFMKTAELNGLTCYNFKKEVAHSPLSSELKCLILESDPTPDYYALNNFPPNKRDSEMHLFLPIKKSLNCFQDIVLRKTCCLNETFATDLHVTPGQLIFRNENHQCIRVRASETKHLKAVKDELEKIGIEFMSDTKINQYETTIFYKKYTEFVKIEENVYQDKANANRYFFPISNHIELNEFLEGIKTIKNNCDYHRFDSFLSFIFIKEKVQDFIGIYSEHCDKTRFGELKEQIKKIFNN